ncbi:MAG: 4Fe-4S dicluster domain-containing protein [Ignavibacteria bacterium]
MRISMFITDDCINCSACEAECPKNAVYPKMKLQDESGLNRLFINNLYLQNGFISEKHYFINPHVCNGCEGVYLEPRCNAVCPVSCCISDEEFSGSGEHSIKIKTDLVSITKISLN